MGTRANKTWWLEHTEKVNGDSKVLGSPQQLWWRLKQILRLAGEGMFPSPGIYSIPKSKSLPRPRWGKHLLHFWVHSKSRLFVFSSSPRSQRCACFQLTLLGAPARSSTAPSSAPKLRQPSPFISSTAVWCFCALAAGYWIFQFLKAV